MGQTKTSEETRIEVNEPAATDNPDILTEALELAERGFHIVPIKPGQKYPAMKAWQHAATTDPDTIRNWLTGLYRDHGIGIAPRQYGDRWLFVLDIDEHDPTQSGAETLQDLETIHGPLPDTLTALTPTGGRHIYLTAPHEIRNDQAGRLGPGIDIRGTGGQVLAPPTRHPNGHTYQWAIDSPQTPSDAPQWLLTLLTPPTPQPAPTTPTHHIWDILDNSPAAKYNHDTTWPQLLQADGWTHSHTSPDGEQHWTRPGKTIRDGSSATVGWQGRDILRVFTSSIPWLPEGAYTRFGYTACRNHDGDRSAFARTLTKTPATPTMTATPTSDPWPAPIPLTTHQTPPDFPNHTLPTWITNWTNQIANNIQVAIDLPNTLAISALSVTTLGNTWITNPRNNWRQPLNTYVAVALPPSAGKTPAKNLIFKPLEDYEQQTIAEAREQKQLNDSRRRILEKQLKDTEDKLAKNNNENNRIDQHHIITDLAALTNAPHGRLLVDDTTTEALGQTLADNNGRIALISAEGGLFDRIAGMYTDGTANLDLYLEAWSGGRYIVDRIKRDSIHIPSANLVIGTTIQPQTLDELGARKNFAGRGLTARFLLTQPPTNLGQRNRLAITHTDDLTQNIYNQKILKLAQHHHANRTELTLTSEAAELYAQYDQHLEDQLGPDQPLEHLAEWVGKLRANTLRLAGLLHIAWEHPGHHIDATTMQQAIDLANYYLHHMTIISDQWGIDETTAKTKKILAWIKRHQIRQLTIRDLMRHNRRLINNADETLPILQLLIDKGWIRPTFDGPILLGQRGKTPQTFEVYPQACDERQMSPNVAQPLEQMSPNVAQPAHQMSPNVAQPPKTPNSVENDPEMSRMSRMSPKGGFQNPPSLRKTTTPPPTPGDMDDMRDISPSTTPNPQTDTLQVIHRLLGLD